MKTIRTRSIFLGLALAGILVLSIFAYFTHRPLLSVDNPRESVEEFYHYNRNLTVSNFFVYFILLLVANIMYIRRRFWDTFIWAAAIFASFTIIEWWWLGEELFHYEKENKLWMGQFSLGPFMGVAIALFGVALAIINYLLLKRMFTKKDLNMIGKDANTITKDSADKQD